MKKRFLLLIMLFFLFSSALSANDLWQKAVEIFGRNFEAWYASRSLSDTQLYNLKGELKDSFIIENIYSLAEDGELESHIVYYEKNGEDLTGQEQEEETEREAPEMDEDSDLFSFDASDSPLNPEYQEKVSYQYLGEQYLDGKRYSRFSYEYQFSDKRLLTGDLWLDSQTGVPYKQSATLDPLPIFLEHVSVELIFSNNADAWYMREMNMDMTGGFLWIKRRALSQITFYDYKTFD